MSDNPAWWWNLLECCCTFNSLWRFINKYFCTYEETAQDFCKWTLVILYGKNMFWDGKLTPDMTLLPSQNWSFACNRDQLNSFAELLGVQVLQAGSSHAHLELFIVSLSLIYLHFEKSVIKTKTVIPKWQIYCSRLK